MHSKSEQYLARLEEMRAEARDLVARKGDKYSDELFRGRITGVRSVSKVMKEKEREVRAKFRGPAKAGGTASSSSRPAPHAKPHLLLLLHVRER